MRMENSAKNLASRGKEGGSCMLLMGMITEFGIRMRTAATEGP